MYGARGTRLDVAKATNTIARGVTKWSTQLTAFLEHVLGYVKGSLDTVLVIDARSGPRDVRGWRLDTSADADYRHPVCFSGIYVALTPVDAKLDDDVFLSLDHSSSGQTYVKLSPAESEFVSAAHGMRATQHYAGSWELICSYDSTEVDSLPECCVVRHRTDNTQAISYIQRGWSSSLAHVPRIYGISVLWCFFALLLL